MVTRTIFSFLLSLFLSPSDPAFDVQQPLVIVNSENLSVSYTGAFFAISHFGRFVKRGMRRLESSFSGSVNVYSMAFRNDREYVIQLVNDSKSINRIKIVQNERCLEIALTPVSITTIVF
jgi:O-glycosyl hydrolase